jgi:hypothetical protein
MRSSKRTPGGPPLTGERAVSTGLSVPSLAGLTNSNVQRCSDCDPGIVYRQCHTADTQYPILSVQLISMTGRIHDFSDNSQRVFFRRISFLLPINFWNFDVAHLVLGELQIGGACLRDARIEVWWYWYLVACNLFTAHKTLWHDNRG